MHLRRSISALALLSLLASLLTLAAATPAGAQATSVFINELHYDNAGADEGEAVEVAGPAGTDLSSYSIVLYNGSNGESYGTVVLSGVLNNDSNGYGFTSVLKSGIQNGSPDALALVDGTTVVQFLSYEGSFTAVGGTADGMTSTDIGVAEPSDTPIGFSLQLSGMGSTYEDFTWTGPSANTFGTVNTDQTFVAPGGNTAPTVTSDPAGLTLEQGETATASITATDDGTVQSLTVTSPDPLPAGITFTSTGPDSGTLTVDSSTAAGSYTITYTATDDEGATGSGSTTVNVAGTVLISDVQGAGSSSPLDGQTVKVQGIVTSLFEDADTLDAFFLQEEDVDSDGDPATSEGIFVFCRGICPTGLAVGDLVSVTGEADEFFGMTQLEPASAAAITVDASGLALPTATAVQLPADGSTQAQDTFENVEGMVVVFPDALVVSEYFELARYGQIVLTVDNRPYQYTHDNAPSVDGYAAYLAELATRRIILDDNNNDQNDAISDGPDEPYPYPTSSWPTEGLSTENYFRGGDTITALTGVMHWSFAGQSGTDAWRIRPIDGLAYDFAPVNIRPATPDEVGGDLTVASFNVLNYFTTIDETSSTRSGPCGPSGTLDCRGADSDAEFQRQQAKIVSALLEIDADVVGLIEIENNDGAVQNLVDALNAAAGQDLYAQIDTGTIGTDAIKVGFIYKPDVVAPVGPFDVLDSSDDPRFIDTKNRPALIQTFTQLSTGGTFTAAVNHFKSKGSSCADIGEDESIVDGQANCSETRRLAAEALADYLATDPTGSGDPDYLILGDLNAYRMEDAIVALEEAGYIDLIEYFVGPDAYSFVFDGQLGYLDYALANGAMFPQVTGATEWHINADEVPLFDYNDEFRTAGESSFERESAALPLYNPDPYRASDHDPVIVGLDLTEDLPPIAEAGGPYKVRVGDSITLDGSGSVDFVGEGLTYAWDFDGDGQFDDAEGPMPTFDARGMGPGTVTVTLLVTDGDGNTSTDTATIDILTRGKGNGGRPPGRFGDG